MPMRWTAHWLLLRKAAHALAHNTHICEHIRARTHTHIDRGQGPALAHGIQHARPHSAHTRMLAHKHRHARARTHMHLLHVYPQDEALRRLEYIKQKEVLIADPAAWAAVPEEVRAGAGAGVGVGQCMCVCAFLGLQTHAAAMSKGRLR